MIAFDFAELDARKGGREGGRERRRKGEKEGGKESLLIATTADVCTSSYQLLNTVFGGC